MSEPSPFPTIDQITAVAWETVIESLEDQTAYEISQALFKQASKSDADGQSTEAEVYRFIGRLASMMIDPGNVETPLRPVLITQTGRSAAPEDYDSVLETISWLMTTTKVPFMRARFGDLLWIQQKNYKGAQEASEQYLESFKLSDLKDKWVRGIDQLARGLDLSVVLGKKKPLFEKYVSFISERLGSIESTCSDAFGLRLVQLLTEHRAGNPKRLSAIAETIGTRLDDAGSSFLAHDYYDAAARCHDLTNNPTESKRLKRKKGHSLVQLANHCVHNSDQGYLAGSGHLASGIECLRQGGEDSAKVEVLHKTLLKWQELSAKEMTIIEKEFNISVLVESAERFVSGKSLRDAVYAMGVNHPPLDTNALRARVHDHTEKFPFSALFAETFLAQDGRVLANKPSRITSDDGVREFAIEAEMFHQATQIDWPLRAQGYIEPSRRKIFEEHRPTHRELTFLVLQNPFIPVGHEALFLKGIVAGFHGDFDAAAHFLVPQIEECIRHVLRAAGHLTSKIDGKLIQEQKLLGTLLALPQTSEVLGERHVFELRGLLCEKFGCDLRNRLAHGFVTYNECWGADVVNLWWLVIRLLCLPHRHLFTDTNSSPDRQAEGESQSAASLDQ